MNNPEYRKNYYKKNKKRIAKRAKNYYLNNKVKFKERRRRYRRNLFKTVIAGYGGKCLFCGEDRPKGLVLHHVNEDGKEHRKEIGTGIAKYHRWLINNNFPDDIVLLCGTCHLILHRTTNKKENDYE